MLEEINILIIEDNNGSVLLFNEVLNRSKRSATTFIEKSAESALYFLTHSKTRIDLILLPITVNKMNEIFDSYDRSQK